MNVSTTIRPVFRMIAAIAVMISVSASIITAVPAAALTTTDLVTDPAGVATDTIAQTVAPVTNLVDSQQTSPTTTSPSAGTATPTDSSSATTPSASTTRTTASSPAATATLTPAGNGKTPADQAVATTPSVTYGSGQISARTAANLYRIAGIAALIGFIVYALTLMPQRRDGGTKAPAGRMAHSFLRRSSLSTKASR